MPVHDVYRAIGDVAKAISREGIDKSRKNQQQGYAFRGIDDIYNALSSLLAKADLCILPRMVARSQEERVTAKGGTLFYVTVQAEFDFVSCRDGSLHTVVMYGEAMDSADKATNKAMSAAYKYACLQVFCIPTEGSEEDADSTTPEPAPRPAPIPEPIFPWRTRDQMEDAYTQILMHIPHATYQRIIAKHGVTYADGQHRGQKPQFLAAFREMEALLQEGTDAGQ